MTGVPAYRVVTRPSYLYDRYDFDTAHPVASGKIVRLARRLATDRRTLADEVGHHAVDLQESVVPSASRTYIRVPLVPYDPARARAMLQADGWVPGPDGIRVKRGRRLSLDIAVQSGAPGSATRVEPIRTWWPGAGAETNVKHDASAAADAALETYKTSFDTAVRARASATIQQPIASDAPVVVYDSRIDTYVANRDLKGYDPNDGEPFDSMMNVDI